MCMIWSRNEAKHLNHRHKDFVHKAYFVLTAFFGKIRHEDVVNQAVKDIQARRSDSEYGIT